MGDNITKRKRLRLIIEWSILFALVVVLIIIVYGRDKSNSLAAYEYNPYYYDNVPQQFETSQLQSIDKYEEQKQTIENWYANEIDKHIDEYEGKKQAIENWYANEFAKLEKWKKQRLEQLNMEMEAAKAWCFQSMQNTTSETTSFDLQNSQGMASTYIHSNNYGTTNAYTSTNGFSLDRTRTSVIGDPASQYAQFLKRIDNEKKSIEDKFSQLRRDKECQLATLESNVQAHERSLLWKKMSLLSKQSGKQSSLLRKQKLRQKDIEIKQQGGVGAITGIAFSEDSESSIICISGEFAHEGDIVDGFKILKIFPDRVEFEKNDEILVQKMK